MKEQGGHRSKYLIGRDIEHSQGGEFCQEIDFDKMIAIQHQHCKGESGEDEGESESERGWRTERRRRERDERECLLI